MEDKGGKGQLEMWGSGAEGINLVEKGVIGRKAVAGDFGAVGRGDREDKI